MKCSRQARWWPAVFAAGLLAISPLLAQKAANAPATVKNMSLSVRKQSPVDFFRQLLAMTPDERDIFLTNRPPEIRARILAKVAEYEALDPNERELRLRATELRWYLDATAARVADQPRRATGGHPEQRARSGARPAHRVESFCRRRCRRNFWRTNTSSAISRGWTSSNNPAEDSGRAPSEAEKTHWNALSEPERRQVTAGFNHFFDLSPDEKQAALNTLSEAERRQMGKTLQAFDKMPPAQRAECVNAFAKFASMSAPDKAEFLKNAERWSAMSPAERQAWRDLVVNVPQWPPLPNGFVAPIPGEANPATNHN